MQRIRAEYKVYIFDKVLRTSNPLIHNIIKFAILASCLFYAISGLWSEDEITSNLYFQISDNARFNNFFVEFFRMGIALVVVLFFIIYWQGVSWNNMLLYHYRNKLTPIKYCFIEFKEETFEYGAVKGRFLIVDYKIIKKYCLKDNKLTINTPLAQLRMDMSYFTSEEQERIEQLLISNITLVA